MGELTDEVALVTGATAGLGRRFASILAAAGASVAVAARRGDRLDELVAEIEDAGGTALAIPVDLTDGTALEAVVEAAEAKLGLVTILVNNAGIPDAQLATRMSLELIDRVIALNVRTPFILAREVAKRLIAAKRAGRIVNIASMAAFHSAQAGSSLYATTKSAVVRMTEALAVEWAAYPINVNAIAPGAFRSEMMDGMIERVGDMSAGFPRKRLGDAADLDGTLLFLASAASAHVTGTCIKVDDGQYPR
ncbi:MULTISPECIES: SDR family NAD(P)-dependent oxidoreductase [unclassified Sphingomonas]|uniref:SDR family NAD(P)-dependent oxidoreductase n=1 Tax=unclassified Sphingomonas TaxID=196159 RepID=UPI0006FEEFF3|nr:MULTISPECIES: SDR family NAD(P)-dependent oxidoreductase [unclassified Sphingomonas]KQX18739.1 short-chain dehydrogenase [Sphingomonas sp. Root1294]KQY71937.1 short-chain dehydrogenase [Sphingomonas sp. Root50]KRB94798.1 short-chain dehydrogenase [Sphingomonas sp. Root720]